MRAVWTNGTHHEMLIAIRNYSMADEFGIDQNFMEVRKMIWEDKNRYKLQ